MASKQKSSRPKSDQWVVVGEYQLDADADMAVTLLDGNGLPVMRFPVAGLVASYWGVMEPIRVLVPPDRVEEARELLE